MTLLFFLTVLSIAYPVAENGDHNWAKILSVCNH